MREAQARCDGKEFSEWIAEFSLEPWDAEVWMLARLTCLLANVNRDAKRHPREFKVNEFLPVPDKAGGKPQTAAEMNAVMERIAAATQPKRKA